MVAGSYAGNAEKTIPGYNTAQEKREESVFERLTRQLQDEASKAYDLSNEMYAKVNNLKRFAPKEEKGGPPEPNQPIPSDLSEYLQSVYWSLQKTNAQNMEILNHLNTMV